MATHSSVLVWRIPGTGEPVGCHLRGCTESDLTEVTQQQQQLCPCRSQIVSLQTFQTFESRDGDFSLSSLYYYNTGEDRYLTPAEILLPRNFPGEGNGNPLQYSCLENPMDGGNWQAAVHGVAKSRTRLSDFTFTHWRRKWQPTPVFLPGESQGRGSLVGCRLWGCTESDTTEAPQQQQQNLNRRRRWHPTPVLLSGKSHGRRKLVGYISWGCKELDTTERLHFSIVSENASPLKSQK